MDSLLRSTGSYTRLERFSHLRFLSQHVVPHLGPSIPHTPYSLTHNGSPIEPSLNFSDSTPARPVLRFTFEALGPLGGSLADPFAQAAATAIIPELLSATGADTRWASLFSSTSGFFLTSSETEVAKERLPPHVARIPQCSIALDLDGSERTMKIYFFPVLKHLVTGVSTENITFNLIRKLEPCGQDFGAPLDLVDAYLAECKEAVPLEMVAIDCVDPTTARVKLYVRAKSNAFNVVRDVLTLGGRLTDRTTLKGLEILRGIWHLLLDEPNGISCDDYSKPVKDTNTIHSGIGFGIEMSSGKNTPDIKVYIPMWQYARSDMAVVENYEAIFKSRNWTWGNERLYRLCIEDAIGAENLNKAQLVHTYASFMFTEKKGAYMTSYFASPLGIPC